MTLHIRSTGFCLFRQRRISYAYFYEYFFAYPSDPSHVGEIIEAAANELRRTDTVIRTWKENNIVGRPITDPIFENISACDAFACDITKLNFNVVFECGYAISKRKPIIITLNDGTINSKRILSSIGIFDTIGYKTFQNTNDLLTVIRSSKDLQPFVTDFARNFLTPIYLIEYPTKSDALARIVSRIKKTRIRYRAFNPQEHTRLSALSAIENVASSSGTVVPLSSDDMIGSELHNIRSAFIAGLSHGFGLPTLILQPFGGPSPADIADFASTFKHPDQINDYIAAFGDAVLDRMQEQKPERTRGPAHLLELSVGDPMAENEMTTLAAYYLDTDEFGRVLRGEANLVVGRKGTGKTALFTQVRDRIRGNKQNIVVDLKPEGYQLKKLREEIVDYITEGAQEHLFTAFWEYLLYLEIMYKILEKDEHRFYRDPAITDKYRKLNELYEANRRGGEGDFSERLLGLAESIAFEFSTGYGQPDQPKRLTQTEITELIHAKYLREIKTNVIDYLRMKSSLWILFDNLDKGWPPNGIDRIDALILRCLIDAGKKIKRDIERAGVGAVCVVFVRNDVYEVLMSKTADFGKEIRVAIDWTQREILREMINRRISKDRIDTFESTWTRYYVPLFKGEASFEFFLDRSLMRPRNLIKMISHTRGYAINKRSEIIDADAIEKGLVVYANDVLKEADQELSDVFPKAHDLLYRFFGLPTEYSKNELDAIVGRHGIEPSDVSVVVDHLLYFGFIGIRRPGSDPEYIYDFQYNMKLMEAYIERNRSELLYTLNPAFWPVLRNQ